MILILSYCISSNFTYASQEHSQIREIDPVQAQLQSISQQITTLDQKIEKQADKILGATLMSNNNNNAQESVSRVAPKKEKPFFTVKQPDPVSKTQKKAQNIYKQFPQEFPEGFKNALGYLENPENFDDLIREIPNKFILFGKPGYGKSHLIQQIHEEFQLPYIKIKSDVVQNEYYGKTGRMITELFQTRDPYKRPLILFIDEFDTIALRRKDSTSEASQTTTTSLLTELDNQDGDLTLFTFVTTNNKYAMDPAMLSRFEGVEILPMTEAHRRTYIESLLEPLTFENLQQKNFALELTLEQTAGLPRREIKKAIRNAQVSARRTGGRHAFVSLQILEKCIGEERRHHSVPLLVQIDRFVRDSQPYLSFIGFFVNIGQSILGEYHHRQGRDERADDRNHQRAWAQEERDYNRALGMQDRKFQYFQFILTQAQRKQDKFYNEFWTLWSNRLAWSASAKGAGEIYKSDHVENLRNLNQSLMNPNSGKLNIDSLISGKLD